MSQGLGSASKAVLLQRHQWISLGNYSSFLNLATFFIVARKAMPLEPRCFASYYIRVAQAGLEPALSGLHTRCFPCRDWIGLPLFTSSQRIGRVTPPLVASSMLPRTYSATSEPFQTLRIIFSRSLVLIIHHCIRGQDLILCIIHRDWTHQTITGSQSLSP